LYAIALAHDDISEAELYVERGDADAESERDEDAIASYNTNIGIQLDSSEAWKNRDVMRSCLARFKYDRADQLLREEITVAYEVFMIAVDTTTVGENIKIYIHLQQVGTQERKAEDLLQIPKNKAIGSELNVIVTAPGFQFNGDNTTSLPLDPDTTQEKQTACFLLTALHPGSTKIQAELYCGDTFQTTLETEVQVEPLSKAEPHPLEAARSRPVPQPELILQVRTIWNADKSEHTFNYHLETFQPRLLFADDKFNCNSTSLSANWVERSQFLLKTTLEEAITSQPEDFRARLSSLGQYLFQSFFPPELQNIFNNIPRFDSPFTLLILADQDAWLPWELLYDGQEFLGDRFIIGRWLWELDKTRPYEFPLGAVNVAHYQNVEQPEIWTALLEPPLAPPPIALPGGVLADLNSTDSMRGLHLVRSGQSSDTVEQQYSPVHLDNSNEMCSIESEVQPAKLTLRRNRPLVTLSYLSAGQPELTVLENTWATTFLQAGCSTFIGPLWAVQPDVEAAFVSSFYANLWSGQSLGTAFHSARQFARTIVPESLDWLAYVLFGDPMARPYKPVQGQGYAIVEPVGQEIDEPISPGKSIRFRVSLRRTPPVWYENRLMEVAEDFTFDNLRVFTVTSGLQVIPADSIPMTPTATGDYLGWFTLNVPAEIKNQSVLVQVYFEDEDKPVHSLRFSLNIVNQDSED
ncbi:MAG: CHAT domain-containing protein, partial [Scytonema sp. PMC 1069.18]|nr:CHAT domain-containing protein [Scytonema sp. PMC 1069.18]